MAAMLSAVRTDCGRPLPAVRSIVPVVGTWQFSKKIIKRASFPILVGKFFYHSSGKNPLHSHRFLIKSLSSKLNIIVQL